ncbi:exocyst complex component sec6 [Rhodotorula toruloides]|uniref:Exocyst complex component sec6 n=1 Tax=Rhodotorula toruloides TaxID=5286 RepID=A0A511KR50_RHOTO|nr:exocyst complex component sec6 [Rhodotorula toruloides]
MAAAIVPHQPTAASAIAEHLSTPPTLTRIPLLRQRIQKERTQLQQTLSQRAKEQVDLVRRVEHQMGDPRGQIDGFGKLVEVSIVHRRLTQTLEMVESLRSMYSRLSHLSDLLSADRSDPLGPSTNLLPIHYHLTELETFRNETLAQAKRATSSAAPSTVASPDPAAPASQQLASGSTTRETLERYFERLGETIEAFEAHYFHLARELLELARNGNSAVAVKLCKIAEVEGARDQKAIAIRMVKKAGTVDVASRFRSLQADARTIKHYRSKVLDAIREGCMTNVEKSFRRAGEDGVRWVEELEWIYEDVLTVRDALVDKFPEDWKIEQVYVKGYHKALYDFLATYVKSGPDAATLLRLSQFTKEYHKTMTKELGVDPDWLKPQLLDGNESRLIDDYFAVITRKMDEWTANLMKTEVSDFVSREQAPEVDPDGYYGMQGAVILFQMLNQQVDLALDSNQASAQWLKLIDQEYRRHVNASEKGTDDVPGGLAEYVMALANDQIKSADFTEALNNRLEPLVSAKYKTAIADKLNDAMDGYLDVAKRCVQILIDVVFHDLRPATKVLFQTSWYTAQQDGSDPMQQIVETFKDYMVDDYQVHLNPNLFDLLIEDILDTFLITYLTAIRRASKIRVPQACERMRSDIDLAFGFFLQYKPKQELVSYFDVLESVLTLVSASKMMVFLDYWPFRKKYGPNLAFTEQLMKARDDLDRSAVSDIMDSVKRKAIVGPKRVGKWTSTASTESPDPPTSITKEHPPVASPGVSRPESTVQDSHDETNSSSRPKEKKPLAFWMVFVALCFSLFLAALDVTSVSTVLPDMTRDFNSADYYWIGSACMRLRLRGPPNLAHFPLPEQTPSPRPLSSRGVRSPLFRSASTTDVDVAPTFGGLANIFWDVEPVLVAALLIFALGSALTGGAQSMAMAIAGRSVQGIGGGAILTMSEIIVIDLVPLAERGAYMGILGAVWVIARQFNLPFTGLALTLVAVFLNIKAPQTTLKEKLERMDYANVVFVAGATSLILGLTWGGSAYAWSSYHVLVPLVLGSFGLAVFLVLERSVVKYPTVPFEILTHPTALVDTPPKLSPIRAGIDLFPLCFTIAPFAILTGASVTVIGKYKAQNIVRLTGMWAGFPILLSIGFGALYAGLNFPVLAPIPVQQQSPAMAFFGFIRSLGQVFAITVGSTILQNQLAKKMPQEYAAQIGGRGDAAFATIPLINDLPEPLRTTVRAVFADSTRTIWWFCLGITMAGLVVSLFMEDIPLATETDEENWGLKEREKGAKEGKAEEGTVSPA